LEVKHEIIRMNLLDDENFVRNDDRRCYFCKKAMMTLLKKYATNMGVELLVDGSNLDDYRSKRPGLIALAEKGVLSPLADIGFSKKDVREVAKKIGLPNWGEAPETCLATRIPEGVEITLEKLTRIMEAEKIVREVVDLKLLRVRYLGDTAKIEVLKEELPKIANGKVAEHVVSKLKGIGFKHVLLDLSGYKGEI
ncbi:MAG: ATP-dependent sacrificial sulfur transferase LarE, partial [Candidatus Methanomethylicota archaeon]